MRLGWNSIADYSKLRGALSWLGYTLAPLYGRTDPRMGVRRGENIVFVGTCSDITCWLWDTWWQRVGWAQAWEEHCAGTVAP